MPEIKAVIFDLGKVIFDLSFERVFQSWANSSHRDMEDIKSKFQFDEVSDTFERGHISAEEFRSKISQRLNLDLSNNEFDTGWSDLYLDIYPGVDDLLVQLKSKCKLVALTNTNIIHSRIWPIKYASTLSYFEKVFSSHEIGTRKPESKAYEIVLNYLECKPAETLFLDDNAENIEGARELGIKTILVSSKEQMEEDLRKDMG